MCKIAIALVAAACALPGTIAAQGRDARDIRARREASNAAIAKHDTAGIGAAYAPNIVVLSSASSLSVGREANLRAFAAIFAERPDVVYVRTPREVHVFAPWAMASEEGSWTGTWTAPDGRVRIGGRYFAKWRRIAGVWLIESETYVPERCTGSSFCASAP